MRIHIHADEIAACPEDDDCLASVFFKSDRRYVSLARFTDPDQDDGQVYVERDDQIYSTYGGILTCKLSPRSLVLDFDTAAAEKLGGVSSVHIDFEADPHTLDQLRSSLHSIFRDHEELEDRTRQAPTERDN